MRAVGPLFRSAACDNFTRAINLRSDAGWALALVVVVVGGYGRFCHFSFFRNALFVAWKILVDR